MYKKFDNDGMFGKFDDNGIDVCMTSSTTTTTTPTIPKGYAVIDTAALAAQAPRCWTITSAPTRSL